MNNELGCIRNSGSAIVNFLIKFNELIFLPRIFTLKKKIAITKPIKNGNPPKKKLKNVKKFKVNIIKVTFVVL